MQQKIKILVYGKEEVIKLYDVATVCVKNGCISAISYAC